jgi:diguanylate cyclase (GGDEF)-like protein
MLDLDYPPALEHEASPDEAAGPDLRHLEAGVVLEACHEGILFLDGQGRIVLCNHRAREILAPEGPRILGLDAADAHAFAAVDESYVPVAPERHPSRIALRTGLPCLGAIHGLQRGPGRTLWIRINAMPLRLGHGKDPDGVVVSVTDITEMKRLEMRLREENAHDELTGLHNRRFFLHALGRAVSSAKRFGHPLCLGYCDLDHFKTVNDTFGHAVGDKALCTFSDCLLMGLRQSDLAARLGGDEFCILFQHTSARDAALYLERVRATLAECPVPAEGHGPVFLTASMGLVDFHPAMDAEAFLEAGDRALYLAKEEGRNRVRVRWPEVGRPA